MTHNRAERERFRRTLACDLEAEHIYPDHPAPIVRRASDGTRELVKAQWGMPPPNFAIAGKSYDRGVTNVRNTSSPHWRRWLGVESRCVVAGTSFAEPSPTKDENGRAPNVWLAIDESRLLFFLPASTADGLASARRRKSLASTTCLPSSRPRRMLLSRLCTKKAMPVILTEPEEVETWLTAPWEEAKALQRPLADGTLVIVPKPESAEAA